MGNEAPVYPTTFGTRSGLLVLRNAVALYFADRSIPAVIAPVGLKYRSFALNQSGPSNANRVVFIPGKFAGGNAVSSRDYGTLTRSTRNHAHVRNPRELLNWDRPFTLSCWSAPAPGMVNDEGLSLALVEDLLEQVVRAVQDAGQSDITWGSVTINAPPVESGFGAELLVQAIQRGPILGETLDYVQPTTGLTASDVGIT